jgi:hypothetical protein
MPIGEAHIHVECDKCGEVTDAMDLTMLAGGGWDARNIPAKLRRWGWRTSGDATICSACVEAETEAANAVEQKSGE